MYKLFPINWRNGKIIIEGKKKEIELNASRVTRYASSGLRAARSPLLDYEIINYERLVENVQVDFVLKCVTFPQIVYQIVPYARDFYLTSFFQVLV